MLFLNLGVDSLVLGFAVSVACASALVFGFVPALQSSRVDLVTVINADASPRGSGRGRLRASLVVAQVAVSLLLLVGAGLVTRSLDAARQRRSRLRSHHVTAIDLDLRQGGLRRSARPRVLSPAAGHRARRRRRGVRQHRGVQAGELHSTRDRSASPIEGYDARRDEDLTFLQNVVSPDYFGTLRIGLKSGRAFEERDDERAAPVAMVNNTFAERFWGGAANAIGKRLRVADGDWRTVIGVAADVKYLRVNESPRPYVYLPFLQVLPAGHDAAHARPGAGRVARGAGARADCGARRRPADPVRRVR